jgi:N4-gp56 family major capsid protein
VVQDTHEDPVLMEAVDILSEQAAQMIETVRYGIIKAGTNVFYANGTARNQVNTPISLSMQRRVTRSLNRQNSRRITSVVRSTPSYGTQNVAPSYVALCHTDVEGDIRNMPGYQPVENYGPMHESEIGKVETVRYFASSLYTPFADAGASTSTMLSTSGSLSDVYPVLYIGRDSYGIVPLKGKAAITPSVVNPRPAAGDPLGQRGYAGWKSMQTAVILNDLWMARAEVAVSINP